MKPTLLLAAGIVLLSCNSKKETDTTKETSKADTTAATIPILPLKMAYEGVPAVGNSDNIVKVMNFNSDFTAGKMDNLGSYFADSVHGVFADGNEFNTVRDSVVAMIKDWRGSMSSSQQSYISAVALDNKTLNHEWVFQWIDETHNYKNGKKEHVIYHEDYRLENGKIREFFQYQQGIMEKK